MREAEGARAEADALFRAQYARRARSVHCVALSRGLSGHIPLVEVSRCEYATQEKFLSLITLLLCDRDHGLRLSEFRGKVLHG